MSIFGWSLPPGCGTLPGEEEYPCAVCGRFEEKCICPECHECGSVGDPECYESHGMELSQEQIESAEEMERKLKEAYLDYPEPEENIPFNEE